MMFELRRGQKKTVLVTKSIFSEFSIHILVKESKLFLQEEIFYSSGLYNLKLLQMKREINLWLSRGAGVVVEHRENSKHSLTT